MQEPNEIDENNLELDDESVDTPLISPFLDSDDDSDDGEVLNKLEKYDNIGQLRRQKAINCFDGDDLAFQCMIGFRKFVAYFDPFLPMNIITRSFAYITNFVVLEDIGEFILGEMVEVVMGKPFRKTTKLEFDCTKGLVSFTRVFDNYTFQMPRTIPRFKHWGHVSWSKIPPIHVLSQRDQMNGFRHAYEKNKFMYKKCLNLGPEYQVAESMKEWLIHGYVSLHEVTFGSIGIHGSIHLMKNWGTGRKAHLLEDKQIPSVGVFDEVFSTWMAFGGYTRDLDSFGEETDKITDLHQISWKKSIQSLKTASQLHKTSFGLYGDGVTRIKMTSEAVRLRNHRRL
ncbi:hypothetical protein Tco_1024218 [Tanacetum coccineum]